MGIMLHNDCQTLLQNVSEAFSSLIFLNQSFSVFLFYVRLKLTLDSAHRIYL